ncbi:MAG: chromosome segregation protein SMC [bacterium]|nr:chromosome segregation protein SMC [bacterium]
MFLRHLRIHGFKSFADKVEFDFGPGITGIVGPNGCGKSNVVDAFRWVLGEQSAKSLRGRQMQDMIFNGSESRRSASMAQIEVVFDNADRTLPLDCDAVSVMRKLYRSGESEYLLNKESVRLKDVRELFMDTGIGTEAYSVIEQGKVDLLLRASPTERRSIFEEAAGISRYKARRREAERKLERTQQNLLRVNDIIEEVERRLRSVKLAAGKARNFQAYETQLRELRSRFSMAEYHRLSAGIGQHEALERSETDRTVQIRTQIDHDEATITKLGADTDRVTEQLASTENEAVRVTAEASALEERIVAARRRMAEQGEILEKAEGQQAHFEARVAEIGEEVTQLQNRATEYERQAEAQRETIDRLNREDQGMARDLAQTQAVAEDVKAGIVELLRQTSRLHNEITTLEQHAETLAGQRGRLEDRDAEIARELEDLLQTRASLESRIGELEQLIEAETHRLDEKKNDASRVEHMRHELADNLARLKEERSGLVSRRQLLNDLEGKMEGVGAAVRKLLHDRVSPETTEALGSIRGIVADLFDVDVVHAAIIEAAIGELDQLLVVEDSRAFLADTELLNDLAGRLTAVFLDRVPPVVNVRDFSSQEGYVARALELVQFPDSLEHLAAHVLGKTIMVETMAAGLRLADTDTEGHRFVTLGGEVIEPTGCISLGPTATGVGLISRKSELRTIDARIEDVTSRVERLDDQLNRTAAEAGHLAQVQQELRTAIYETHTAKVEAGAALQNVAESIRRLTAEQPLVVGEVTSLGQQISEAGSKRSANHEDLDRLGEAQSTREEEVASYQQRLDEIVAERQRLAVRLVEARVTDGQLGEKRAAVTDSMAGLRRAMDEARQGASSAAGDLADCAARISESETIVLQGGEAQAELGLRKDRLEAEALQLRRSRDLVRVESEELSISVRELRAELEEVEEQLHAHQIELGALRVRREDLTTRVADELAIDLAEAYAAYEHTDEDWEAIENRIAELRQKIDRLGNVNLDAISEQEELEERCMFLTTQRDDLETSHRQLEQLIDKLNRESRERFLRAFSAIRENFQDLFRKLFGGGKADILLEDPNDPLECGIEIMVRPPGKEFQSLLLLSGGEKSMTAIALVMSIFRSRPSPFTILDEVDAALDEANNVRFNNIVRDFLDRSQFVVITHSKRTMNIADHMYGVTMQEPGVSSLVSVKFEHESSPADDLSDAVA